MVILLHIPTFLSLLVLAAHFLYWGNSLLMAASLLLMSLMFIPRPWAARVLQVVLLLAAAEWILTTANLVAARRASGDDYARAAAILLAVAAVNLLAAFLFRTKRLARRYRLVEPAQEAAPRTSAPAA